MLVLWFEMVLVFDWIQHSVSTILTIPAIPAIQPLWFEMVLVFDWILHSLSTNLTIPAIPAILPLWFEMVLVFLWILHSLSTIWAILAITAILPLWFEILIVQGISLCAFCPFCPLRTACPVLVVPYLFKHKTPLVKANKASQTQSMSKLFIKIISLEIILYI